MKFIWTWTYMHTLMHFNYVLCIVVNKCFIYHIHLLSYNFIKHYELIWSSLHKNFCPYLASLNDFNKCESWMSNTSFNRNICPSNIVYWIIVYFYIKYSHALYFLCQHAFCYALTKHIAFNVASCKIFLNWFLAQYTHLSLKQVI